MNQTQKLDSDVYSILQSLCRIGLGSDNTAFRQQVERLISAVEASEDKAASEPFRRLLANASKTSSMQPSSFTISQVFTTAEVLTERTPPPVDKDAGAPLAEIAFPGSTRAEMPILEESTRLAVDSVANEWLHISRLQKFGVSPPISCLMYGRPGTGKTQIALAMAKTLGLPVVLARLDGLVSSFLGNTARNIATLFRFANRYRCILLLDEFDAIAKVRDDPQEVGEIKRVVNTILQNIDLRREQGITIAITNHEQLLDPAVWRRFQVRIHIPVPSFAERQLIILKYFPPVELTELQVRFIAWLSEGMTGADIEVMSQNVKRFLALNESQSILTALKHNTLTHAGRQDTPNLGALLISEGKLALLLADSKDLNFRQKDIAVVLDTSQSKVNRLLKAYHEKAA